MKITFKFLMALVLLDIIRTVDTDNIIGFEECKFDFFPIPQKCRVASSESILKIDPCSIIYKVEPNV